MSISSRLTALSLVLAAMAATTGCVEHALVERFRDEPEIVYPPADDEPTEGAIWRGPSKSGSFLYYDRKARGLGDLVTVLLVDSLSAEGSANTSTDSNSNYSASLSSDVGLANLASDIADFFLGILGVGGGGGAQAGQSLNVLESNRTSSFEGDGETTRESSFSGVVTCRVLEELPGGLLRIRGKRELLVNHELQLVTVSGLVRRSDINIDNTVNSTQLADAKLTFDGLGVLDDKQRPPLMARIMDWVYPF